VLDYGAEHIAKAIARRRGGAAGAFTAGP